VNADTADHRRDAGRYEIRLGGLLASRWAAAFDPMTVTTHGDGTTSLRGTVVDQAALHGLLTKLRDLGLPLLSLTQLASDPAPATRIAPAGPNDPFQGD
jgi:hypothetical protein